MQGEERAERRMISEQDQAGERWHRAKMEKAGAGPGPLRLLNFPWAQCSCIVGTLRSRNDCVAATSTVSLPRAVPKSGIWGGDEGGASQQGN